MIWYAAYGSNLLEERFLTYLRGGSVAGSTKVESGARDTSEPIDARPYMVPRRLGFGYRSTRWNGGGVCFVDPEPVAGRDQAFGRAWLVSVEQFEDVWAQENGDHRGPELNLGELATQGHVVRPGNYGRVELLGDLDGLPVATITCNEPPELNAADVSYLSVVGRGLMETWALSAVAAADYLVSCRGNDGLSGDKLVSALRS